MSKHVRIPLLIAVVLALGAAPASAATPAYKDARQPVAKRVSDLLSRMTLEDKVGQMTQAERAQFDKTDEPNQSDNDDLITTWRLGSILSGGGSTPPENTPKAWADMVDRYQRRALATPLGIPLIYGIDSVHGDGNMLGATVFPHNIGLGATRDPSLVREVEHITASETRSTGPQWSFAPCICAARDDRWGRTYESFGEDPRLVEKMETAIDGFQGRAASSRTATACSRQPSTTRATATRSTAPATATTRSTRASRSPTAATSGTPRSASTSPPSRSTTSAA